MREPAVDYSALMNKMAAENPLPTTEYTNSNTAAGEGYWNEDIMEAWIDAMQQEHPWFETTRRKKDWCATCPGNIEEGWYGDEKQRHDNQYSEPNSSTVIWVHPVSHLPCLSCMHYHCAEGSEWGKKKFRHLLDALDPERSLFDYPKHTDDFSDFAEVVAWDEEEPPSESAPGAAVAAAPEPVPVEEDSLAFPIDCLYGTLGEQAKQMNMPLGYAYPSMLAAYSVEPVYDDMLATRINIYLVVIGPIGQGKNEAIKRAIKLRGLMKGIDWKRTNIASDRGLLNVIGEQIEHVEGQRPRKVPGFTKFLIQTNEIATIFKKAAIENSTLFEMLCDLWDENDLMVSDKKGKAECDCRLSWIGGCPLTKLEDFAKVFGKQSSFGLYSRFLLAYTTEDWRFKAWTPPAETFDDSPVDSYDLLAKAPAVACTRVTSIDPKAQALADDWYPKGKAADPSGRLFYNLMKVAILSASASHENVLSVQCMECAIKFMEWQIALREHFKPGEANTENAAFGEKMLNHFAKQTMKQVKAGEGVELNWRRISHDQKWGKNDGGWLVFSTIQNFLKIGELIAVPEYDEKGEEKKIDTRFGTLPAEIRLPRG